VRVNQPEGAIVRRSTEDSPNPRQSAAAARIRTAATAAFAELGYGATSTRDITRRLGLSAAAMYPHYESKEALLYAISLDGHQAALRALSDADDPHDVLAARLHTVVATFTRWQAHHSALARVLQYELRSLTPEHRRAVIGIRRQTTAVLGAIIDAGLVAGEFTTTDADGALLAISSLCVDVCRWFPSRTHSDPDDIARLYADLAVRIVM
jgi:AcrR family transcriptional regulator